MHVPVKSLVLAALALAALAAAPSPTTLSREGPLHTDVVSAKLVADGPASLDVSQGGVLSEGPFTLRFDAAELTVETYRYDVATLHSAVLDHEETTDPRSESTTYHHARVTVQGEEDGILYVLADRSSIDVPLGELSSASLFASSSDWIFWSQTMQDVQRGPLLGFQHDPQHRFVGHQEIDGGTNGLPRLANVDFTFPRLLFGDITVRDPTRVSVDNATIVIEHDGGVTELRAARDSTRTPILDKSTVTSFLLAPRRSQGTLALGDASAAIASSDADLHLDGEALLSRADGVVEAGSQARGVNGSDVRVAGNLTFHLAAGGAVGALGDPPIASRTDGEVRRLEVDGAVVGESVVPLVTPRERTFVEAALASLVIAWTLASRAFVPLFIRDPLANPRRVTIVRALRAAGFRHMRGLQRDTGLPLGTLTYHLAILRRAGAVRAIRVGNRQVFVLREQGLTPQAADALCVLASEPTARVAHALASAGSATQAELALALGVDRSTVSRQLARLIDRGLARAERNGETRYHAQPLLTQWTRRRQA